ncbi:TPA: DUF2971 domain-containing protein [Enterobacter roggenkampii]|uniref:DUF2971 domain-containing protein n=1 Tax=Enterobacter bugandensis TaxID=881260 RepID=UPI0031DC5C70
MSLPILYKYSSFKNGIKSIQNQKFKWSSINDFNDPFESRFHVSSDIKTKIRLAALSASIRGGLSLTPEMKKLFIEAEKRSKLEFTKITALSDRVKRKFNEYSEPNQKAYEEIERIIWNEVTSSSLLKELYDTAINFSNIARRMMENQFGILCLSKSFNNPLMWGHYASDHKGIMFEFDFSRVSHKTRLYCSIKEVNYQSDYPEMSYETLLGLNNAIFPEQSKEFMKILSYTKHDAWKYEQEYRSLASNNALDKDNLAEIPKECFKSITIGCSADESSIEHVANLVKKEMPDTKIYHNSLDSKNYKLIRTELS